MAASIPSTQCHRLGSTLRALGDHSRDRHAAARPAARPAAAAADDDDDPRVSSWPLGDPLVYSEELPGADTPGISPEEAAFFRENGFCVKVLRRIASRHPRSCQCYHRCAALPSLRHSVSQPASPGAACRYHGCVSVTARCDHAQRGLLSRESLSPGREIFWQNVPSWCGSAFFAPFSYNAKRPFVKTGSGQRNEKALKQRMAFLQHRPKQSRELG